MFSFLKKKHKSVVSDFSFLGCDMHSHLVAGIDDGAKSLEESLSYIQGLRNLGFRKLITTPHIYGEIYNNNTEIIQTHFHELRAYVQASDLDVELEVSAEYFLDNHYINEVLPQGLMPFGDKYVLVEVSMAGWQHNFHDLVFSTQSKGYTPILAHPERYNFEKGIQFYQQLKSQGMLLQMNLLSITGYYGKSIKAQTELLMEHGLYDFCGTDLHHAGHLERISMIPEKQPEVMEKLAAYKFRNNELIDDNKTV